MAGRKHGAKVDRRQRKRRPPWRSPARSKSRAAPRQQDTGGLMKAIGRPEQTEGTTS